MSRADNRLKKSIIKKILNSGKIPKEKQEELCAVLDSLDIKTIVNNPSILNDLKENPSNLSKYVSESEKPLTS